MARYFLEIFYKGTNYSGFQIQKNANSIQAEVEKALSVFYKQKFELTGASRTDAGVHALQNYFHFDCADILIEDKNLYNLNAILPADIVIKGILSVQEDAHCRFDAVVRQYQYFIYNMKDPFQADRAYFFPYRIDLQLLNEAAKLLLQYTDFEAFSKRNSQAKHFGCSITRSEWSEVNGKLVYTVAGNRFLRGMVRGLVGTMLKVGTGKTSIKEFINIIESRDASEADFSVPAHGLFLTSIIYPADMFL